MNNVINYIIGGIGIIICLFVAGYFIKRKYYSIVDELESWKIEIMNRPILDELAKVKKLNMIGQTEELFESWRNRWDDIVAVQLPDIEELLFDTEEYIDKYKFSKAKKTQDTIRMKLEATEQKMEEIVQELNELVDSEENNRTDIEELKEIYRVSKKTLLAHRHAFGSTEKKMEEMIREVTELLSQYEEKTAHGDYLKARDIVYIMKEKLETVALLIEKIPPLLIECQTKIPEQIRELKDGYTEMLANGFILDHLQLESEIELLKKDLDDSKVIIHEGNVDQVEPKIAEIQEKLDLLYDLLEKEVVARNYCNKNVEPTKQVLASMREGHSRLQVEVEIIQKSYNLHNEDIELQYKLEKKITSLFKQFEVLEHKLTTESAAHTVISQELKVLKDQLEEARTEQDELFHSLHALREDELVAHERIKELSTQISQALRMVANSNIPGVTEEFKSLVEEAKESIARVKGKLEQTPLDMIVVKEYVQVAEEKVSIVVNTTTELVETVYVVEKIIQYGNRYRRQFPSVEKSLVEAEQAFRSYQYKEALEVAVTSIEEVEPGSMKKLDSWMEEWKKNEPNI